MPFFKSVLLVGLLIAIAGSVIYIESKKPARPRRGQTTVTAASPVSPAPALNNNVANIIAKKSAQFPRVPEIVSPSGFINTNLLKLGNLVGKKVILVDFWTYSCINCQRTIPYLNAWYDKYKDKGLEIVGIHTPEFEFEKKYDNVRAATQKFGVKYPVIMDNDYGTWENFRNRYWPHKFLVDIDGYIVYDHIGEGNYEETEAKIQDLLKEKMARVGEREELSGYVNPTGVVAISAASPETYFGSDRNEYLGNGSRFKTGEQTMLPPIDTNPNQLYLVGGWNFSPEFAANTSAGKILYRYRAKGIYLVASGEREIRAEVRRDGLPLTKEIAGEDIIFENEKSYVVIKVERLYRLVQDSTPGEHQIEIIIQLPGLKAYAFTFG